MPLIIGRIADSFGLRTGMCMLYLTFGWIFAVRCGQCHSSPTRNLARESWSST